MRINFLQKIIDILRGKKKYKPLYMFPQLLRKHDIFYNYKEHINTIILGSSHSEFGYRAGENEINLGLSYQDLYYNFKIYEIINNPKIKNIILFYSVFTPGDSLIMSKSRHYAIAYKMLWGIPYQDENIANDKGLTKLENGYKKRYKKLLSKSTYKKNDYGNEEKYLSSFENLTPEQRAKLHYKINQKHNNQTKYVVKMAKLMQKYEQNMYIVLSPATCEYKEFLPKSEELFAELYSAVKNFENIKIINCYDINFEKNEFVDWDHLNLDGAIKLTDIIKDFIKKNED